MRRGMSCRNKDKEKNIIMSVLLKEKGEREDRNYGGGEVRAMGKEPKNEERRR